MDNRKKTRKPKDPKVQSPSQEQDGSEERTPSNQQGPSTSPIVQKSPKLREVSISTEDMSHGSRMNVRERSSRDASTNTIPSSVDRKAQRTETFNIKDDKSWKCIEGVVDCHDCFLSAFPTLKTFLLCIPIRYGVHTIIACEQIYFFLRSYSRVLHLAMPNFYPDLTTWLAATELLLSLAVLLSDVFLLVGAFINPDYILYWIDIHVLEIFIYLFLSVWLAVYGSMVIYHYPLLFSAYILAFLYSIAIVNSFRRCWDTGGSCPSDLGPTAQQSV